MAFPDWAEKFRTKGTAINKVKDKYYLYRVHSERIKGTDKVRKVNDEYLGRITEAGLIAPKSKINGNIIIKEYGIYAFILSINDVIIKRIIKDFNTSYKTIITVALIQFLYGSFNDLLYKNSFMSVVYPNIDFNSLNSEELITIERLENMFKSYLVKLDIDLNTVIHALRNTNMVYINNKWYLSEQSNEAKEIIEKFNIYMEGLLCQELAKI
jgi:hypothetical protein